jgi:hypothetical protein
VRRDTECSTRLRISSLFLEWLLDNTGGEDDTLIDAPDKEVLGVTHRVTRVPDLTKLREMPRAEAIRVAMIMYGWDAAKAVRKVDIEQSRYPEQIVGQKNWQDTPRNTTQREL